MTNNEIKSQLLIKYSTIDDGNMSFVRGDHTQTLKNRQNFLKKYNLNLEGIIVPRTQHGLDIKLVGKTDLGKGARDLESTFKVDGLLTNEREVYLFLVAADCQPISLFDPKNNAIGLIHASWKNLDLGIIQKGVTEMTTNFQTDPKELQVQIGPSVGPCCYKGLDEMNQKDKPEWKDFISSTKAENTALIFGDIQKPNS
jgi:polyphenol oxidase